MIRTVTQDLTRSISCRLGTQCPFEGHSSGNRVGNLAVEADPGWRREILHGAPIFGSAVNKLPIKLRQLPLSALAVPFSYLLVWALVFIEVVHSLVLLSGIRSRSAALSLAALTIVATTLLRPDSETEMHIFYRDVAILGALMVIAMRRPRIPSPVAATFAVPNDR